MSIIPTTAEPQQSAEPSDQPWCTENIGARRYIYCIIDGNSDEPISFGSMGIGHEQPEVFAIPHESVAAVVSSTSCEKFEISRENTIVHQRVMEAVMARGHTVLPVRFDTIAEDKPDGSADAESRIVNHVLTKRLEEFSGLLATMRTRDELGVKGLWTDIKAIFGEIVDSNDHIRSLRGKLLTASRVGSVSRRGGHVSIMDGKPKLGEMVKNALEAEKLATEKQLVARLGGTVVDVRKNKTFGDPMFANLALLVENSRMEDFEAALSAFEADQAGQIKLKYIGPVPPSNFIEVVITWDD